jgi:succinoglycan biosynthesis protein ExoH
VAQALAISGDVSKRIDILRLGLVIGIAILHVPPHVPMADMVPGVFSFIKSLLANAVFRSSVPVLTCISGFILFKSGLDRDVRDLVVKKTRTLLLPLLFWNLPIMALLYAVQAFGVIDYPFRLQVYPFEFFPFVDASLGLTGEPVNYPLWFLRDLFVLALLAPIIGMVLRRAPWIGLVLIGAAFWLDLDGPVLMRNTMMINFYLGGMAAHLGWDLEKLDRYAPVLAIVFLGCCLAIVGFRMTNRSWFSVLAPILVWPASVWLVNTRIGEAMCRAARHSFFLFLTHGPILLVLWLLYTRVLPAAPYVVFYVLAPPIVVTACLGADTLFRRAMPRLHHLVVGGRG